MSLEGHEPCGTPAPGRAQTAEGGCSAPSPSLPRLSERDAARTVGITTTVPSELIFAAGLIPMDLNNLFIGSGVASDLVAEAEACGFPRNSCAWNKGVYATARRLGLRRVAAVVQGDCSNTHAMMEMLRADGVDVVPFSYPYSPDDAEWMQLSLERFARALGASLDEGERWKKRLDEARAATLRIDALCWRDDLASSEEQHLWTLSCSDFLGDPDSFRATADALVSEAEGREPRSPMLRLALLGIPPICEGFFEFLDRHGARVVFNETPRQFAMPKPSDTLAEQYLNYTYPYDVFYRLADIREQIAERRVDGAIHYVQSFCYRHTQDTLIRRALNEPVLTIECDRPAPLDLRTQTRIEAFIEMLQAAR